MRDFHTTTSSSGLYLVLSCLPQVFRTESPPIFRKRAKNTLDIGNRLWYYKKSGSRCVIKQVSLPKYPYSAHFAIYPKSLRVAQNSFFQEDSSFLPIIHMVYRDKIAIENFLRTIRVCLVYGKKDFFGVVNPT